MSLHTLESRDEMYGAEWYSVYAGVEYAGGDNIYADYDHSTNGLSTEELADELFALGNLYTKEENLENLREMMQEDVTAPLRTIPTKKYFTVTARNIDWDIWGDEEHDKLDLPSEVTIPDQFETADYEYDYGSFDMDKLRETVKAWLSNRKEYDWHYASDFDLIVY